MMMGRNVVLLCVCVSLLTADLSADTGRTKRTFDKKLIQYGWGIPTPRFIRENIREMEKRPFDGLIFQLSGGRKVLTPSRWNESAFTEDYEQLRHIKWKRFTDNFIIMHAASELDWFNDEHWQAIEHNARLLARGARIGGCVGMCFDSEPYGTNPWTYTKAAQHGVKSFSEYEAVVRSRGAQFMRAIESELPGVQLLTFFHLSSFDQLLVAMEPAKRQAKLSKLPEALLPAFLNGILDAASTEARIIDGNEPSYYYAESRAYYEAYHRMKQGGLLLVDPNSLAQYRRQVQAGHAVYIDHYFGLRRRRVLGHYLSPEDRLKWFEHNVYWALRTSDRYVWCYCERMHWFRNENIPTGCEQAIRSARHKVANGLPLGIDLTPVIERAHKVELAALAERIKRRSAAIVALGKDVVRPAIDGRIDDAAWKHIAPLDALVSLASRPERLNARTTVQVTYDDAALYLAIRCEEPYRERMSVVGESRDDDVWLGDDVEVMVSAPGRTLPFYHFMLNPQGVAWDAVHVPGGIDTSFDPDWKHGTQVAPRFWSAEMAIPWTALNLEAPKPGMKLHANVCRTRKPDIEFSAWSPMIGGFLEHELFGTWVFH